MIRHRINPKTIEATLARETDSIERVLRRMDWAALEIVLVVDKDGKLAGTVTDGDARRGILKGMDMTQPASAIMNPNPVTVQADAPREEMLRIMRRFSIRRLPCLDTNGRPVRLELLENLIPDDSSPTAVIMAGGLGQRLRPLTESTPKPMLEVAEKPILDHILAGLSGYGVKNVAISVNYLGDKIREHVGNGQAHGMNVNYITENERLGTAGALAFLSPRPSSPFLVMNGDLLTGVNFSGLMRFQAESGHDIVVCARRHSTVIPYGVLEIENDRILRIEEKPSVEHFINAGIYVIHPRCLDLIPRGAFFDMPDLIRSAMDKGFSAGAFPIIEYWRDIGNPDDYLKANVEKLNSEAAIIGECRQMLEIAEK